MGLNTGKAEEMLHKCFPFVEFYPFGQFENESYSINDDRNAIENYILIKNGEYFLDIPKMAEKDFLKPLFPARNVVKEYEDELFEEINIDKISKEEKHPDISKFFIMKDDEKFAETLNSYLEHEENKLIPGETLTELFYGEMKKSGFCQYSRVAKNNGEFEDKLIWDFSKFCFSHSPHTIYDAFYYFSKKNCTLYLFGVEFINFRDYPGNWPVIPGEIKQTLPCYFCESGDITKGLAKYFNAVNVDDFVWREGAKWTEEENKQYLLKLFKLDESFNVSLKNIYHCFCMPLLKRNDYSQMQNNNRVIMIGDDIINNTLKRNLHLAKKLISKHSYAEDYYAWIYIINEILEGDIKENDGDASRGMKKHCPITFEAFICRIANKALRTNIKKTTIQLTGVENSHLDHADRKDINNYFKEIIKLAETIELISEEDKASLCEIQKNGNAYDKINIIYKLMTYNQIRIVFQRRYRTIENLFLKTSVVSMDETFKTENNEFPRGETLEDKKWASPEQKLINEEWKKIVIRCFREEFPGSEKKWIQFIQDESAIRLQIDLRQYPPNSFTKQEKGTDSNLFKNYLKYTAEDTGNKGKLHTMFKKHMRNIADELEKKGNWLG